MADFTNRILRRALPSLGLLATAAVAHATGCASGDPDPNPVPVVTGPCVPSEIKTGVEDGCGIFVASTGDDEAAGTKAKPVKSLAKAISMANGKTARVYACAEAFPEAVEVPAGISIYGGLTCAGGSWAHAGGDKKTTIAPPADAIPLKLSSGSSTTHIEDVEAIAADASLPSGSSIAAIVDSAKVDLVRCRFVAGAGATGEIGATPPGEVMPSDPNHAAIVGNNGSNACMGGGSGNLGGEPKSNPGCGLSSGGTGGTGQEAFGESGTAGAPLPTPNPSGFGLGGVGGTGSGCTTGYTGSLGLQGAAGAGATLLGTIDAKGYVGAAGSPGLIGLPGQGGGGGGGAKGKSGCYGASGGGGGTGGCGGMGGNGGLGGGSSIALLSIEASITFEAVELLAGSGGKGGEGGVGQLGGIGGNGGVGGLANNGLLAGCAGGVGGPGGIGGKGGGGVGGHSLGIAFRGSAPPAEGVTITTGAAGEGGLGEGAVGNGAAGVKADTQSFGD